MLTSIGSLHAQIFYVPLSVAIPPSVYMVHRQFNLIYQFWIHTEVVDRLGPLEWILNTPSHHRVHHGGAHFTRHPAMDGGGGREGVLGLK